MDDFFAELEAEIAAATAKAKQRSDAEALRKKSLNMKLPTATRNAAAADYKALAAIVEAEQWAATATVAMFTEQHCDGCGSTHRVFLQFMEAQCLIRRPTTQRWVRVTRPAPAEVLPRETLIQPAVTHICAHCCEDHGFTLDGASHLKPLTSSPTVSPTYFQEDINAPA